MPRNDLRLHAAELRELAAAIRRDGLHGHPGTLLPVDHFGRAPRIIEALDKAAGLLEEAADAPDEA